MAMQIWRRVMMFKTNPEFPPVRSLCIARSAPISHQQQFFNAFDVTRFRGRESDWPLSTELWPELTGLSRCGQAASF
jgi:hypothetical protein